MLSSIEGQGPTEEDSPIKKFPLECGEWMQHIAITTDEIKKDITRAAENRHPRRA